MASSSLANSRGLPFLRPFVVALILSCVYTSFGEEHSGEDNPGYKLYLEALSIREKQAASYKEQRTAASLLAQAAGVRFSEQGALTTDPLPTNIAWEELPGFPGIEISNVSFPPALRELAKVYQDGYGVESNQRLSLELYRRAADLGDAEAQGAMGMRFALGLQRVESWSETGIHNFGQPDEAQAVLHYYFASMSGDPFSQIVMGYRHLYGHGVPKSCWSAISYWQPLAENVLRQATLPSQLPIIEKIRLHVQANQGLKSDRHKEVLHYYQYSADRGNVDAQTAVGQVFNYGTHGIQRDHAQALKYFHKAAEAQDQEAMAHLGHMYANGFGTKDSLPDPDAAFEWFSRAAKRGHASALYGLGYMYLVGQPFAPTGIDVEHSKALKYLTQAAEAGSPDAHFFLGVMHLRGWGTRRKNLQKAFSYFHIAAMAGQLQAMYNTAMMHLSGKGTSKSCRPAAVLLKQIIERGPTAAALQRGHEQFFKGSYSSALLMYLQAGEMGMELGQSNAAWMMDRGYGQQGGASPHLSFRLHQMSAEQGNLHSLLQMGDRFYYGNGVRQDWVRAAAIYYEAYQVGAVRHQDRSPESMFNLGFMHEFGAGVPQNLDLARKFYRMAAAGQPDSAPGMYVALAWLALHETWLSLLPSLPHSLDFIWSKVLVLTPPHTTVLGPLGSWLASSLAAPTLLLVRLELTLARWLELLGSWQSYVSGVQDVSDTALLLLLAALLFVVLKIKQSRQHNRQQQAAAAAAVADASADGAAAGQLQPPVNDDHNAAANGNVPDQ